MEQIEYGQSFEEQHEIIRKIVKLPAIEAGSAVTLDITHGLRHLPLLTVLIAMYLQEVKKVEIRGIYYGAYELYFRNNYRAPVVRMDGLMELVNWISALKAFDKDGDYGQFADLLQQDGLTEKQARRMKGAAFAERNMNISLAAQKLKNMSESLGSLYGMGELFGAALQERISWHNLGEDIDETDEKRDIKRMYLRQRALVWAYFSKGDYLRAAIFALEALVTWQMKAGENPENFEDRDFVLKQHRPFPAGADLNDMLTLNAIRNRLAHGSFIREARNDYDEQRIGRVNSFFESEENLSRALKTLIDKLLPENIQ
ncbi:MAG: TIGR02221 family CRISPR-associated protein [Methylococcales bacterium]